MFRITKRLFIASLSPLIGTIGGRAPRSSNPVDFRKGLLFDRTSTDPQAGMHIGNRNTDVAKYAANTAEARCGAFLRSSSPSVLW